MAGDWLARLGGFPRTLAPDIIHKNIAETIIRHQNAFFPVQPMQVTPSGYSTTHSCYVLQNEPYLGCEAIYENFVDDGLETIHRVYDVAWLQNESPWDSSLVYDAPEGGQGGLRDYMTCPTTWHVLNALSGVTLDLPHSTLYVSPRLTTKSTELHIPVYLSRFWGWLDYVPAKNKLTFKITAVYPDDVNVEKTLYHFGETGLGTRQMDMKITQIAADGDGALIRLPKPFEIKAGATLDLSSMIGQLHIPVTSEIAR